MAFYHKTVKQYNHILKAHIYSYSYIKIDLIHDIFQQNYISLSCFNRNNLHFNSHPIKIHSFSIYFKLTNHPNFKKNKHCSPIHPITIKKNFFIIYVFFLLFPLRRFTFISSNKEFFLELNASFNLSLSVSFFYLNI
jgi:hypothetical protein